MAEDPESPRHLPIHRFKSAEWNGNSALTPKGFNLDSFIESQNIGFLVSKKLLGLEVIFEPMAGFHLTETPISKDQILKQLEDGEGDFWSHIHKPFKKNIITKEITALRKLDTLEPEPEVA